MVAEAGRGFRPVSFDLIYGTPGVDGRLAAQPEAVCAAAPDHISAYAQDQRARRWPGPWPVANQPVDEDRQAILPEAEQVLQKRATTTMK